MPLSKNYVKLMSFSVKSNFGIDFFPREELLIAKNQCHFPREKNQCHFRQFDEFSVKITDLALAFFPREKTNANFKNFVNLTNFSVNP